MAEEELSGIQSGPDFKQLSVMASQVVADENLIRTG